ncbi:MAG: hypothetical protein ILP18_03485, partial [Treponema sp.]|nr:hypothetical protein [Treponema sp.]
MERHRLGKIVLPVFRSVKGTERRFGNIPKQLTRLGKGDLFPKIVETEFGKELAIKLLDGMRIVPPVPVINGIGPLAFLKRICVRRDMIDVIIDMSRFMSQHMQKGFPFPAAFDFDFVRIIRLRKNAVVPQLKPFIKGIPKGIDIKIDNAVHPLIFIKNKIRQSAIAHSLNKIHGIDMFQKAGFKLLRETGEVLRKKKLFCVGQNMFFIFITVVKIRKKAFCVPLEVPDLIK